MSSKIIRRVKNCGVKNCGVKNCIKVGTLISAAVLAVVSYLPIWSTTASIIIFLLDIVLIAIATCLWGTDNSSDYRKPVWTLIAIFVMTAILASISVYLILKTDGRWADVIARLSALIAVPLSISKVIKNCIKIFDENCKPEDYVEALPQICVWITSLVLFTAIYIAIGNAPGIITDAFSSLIAK